MSDVIKLAPHAQASETSYVNLNRVVNRIARDQGIEIGSWDWLLGGAAAFFAQAGGQQAFGWDHRHKLTPKWIRAVIANFGDRRCFYQGAPFRQFGYYAGGRPIGWTPESQYDQPDGTTVYPTSAGFSVVSNPELEHVWLDSLWALITDPNPIEVKALGTTLPSNIVARAIASLIVSSIIGQIRSPENGKPYPWVYGGRADSRLLDTILQAGKYGCLNDPVDIQTAGEWIQNVFLPFYEASPGVTEFTKNPDPKWFEVGTFNGTNWLNPVCYEASKLLPSTEVANRFAAITKRLSQWCFDLEQMVPGRGFDMASFKVDRAAFTAGSKPLASIKDLLDPSRIIGGGFEEWSFRSACVAAKVIGAPELVKARDGIRSRHSDKVWLVDEDRNPVA